MVKAKFEEHRIFFSKCRSRSGQVVKKSVFKFHFYHDNFSNWTIKNRLSQKNVFQKFFGSSINFGRFWSIFAYFEPKYLQNGLIWRSLVFCVCFVSILSHFWPNFVKIYSGWRENAQKPLKKSTKIGRFEVKFSTWRRQVGKNLMRRTHGVLKFRTPWTYRKENLL